ncbi:MAG: hypothetical protein A3J06_04370 [Candidatus Moranbacteria bacterium RIFCSPLOWO2_02_FULL_48_19]|nr:MAG: hypothetical protein A3J06_04370 [Candidatus Moranbacteria bacterium RIFCSPLOWO2_02_FULL_48_19]OGI31600.1 MAG: hypothetical protein A3G09_04295 [Candidatus Moranbacteria bacterium RIFCSPLOWO2_12_FULL_48_12]
MLGERKNLGVKRELPDSAREEMTPPIEAANDASIEQPKSYEDIGGARVDSVKSFFKSRISGALETMKAWGGALKGGAEKTLNTAFAAPEMIRDAGTAVKQGVETHVTRAADMSRAFGESVVEKGFQVGESVRAGASEIYQSGREKVQNLQERGMSAYMNAKMRVDSAKNTFSEKKNALKARALEKIMQVRNKMEERQKMAEERAELIRMKERELAQLKASSGFFVRLMAM